MLLAVGFLTKFICWLQICARISKEPNGCKVCCSEKDEPAGDRRSHAPHAVVGRFKTLLRRCHRYLHLSPYHSSTCVWRFLVMLGGSMNLIESQQYYPFRNAIVSPPAELPSHASCLLSEIWTDVGQTSTVLAGRGIYSGNRPPQIQTARQEWRSLISREDVCHLPSFFHFDTRFDWHRRISCKNGTMQSRFQSHLPSPLCAVSLLALGPRLRVLYDRHLT